jgi:outer membrane protein
LNRIQIQLSDARISEVNALINYRLALLEMKIQSLWNFEEDRSALDIDK